MCATPAEETDRVELHKSERPITQRYSQRSIRNCYLSGRGTLMLSKATFSGRFTSLYGRVFLRCNNTRPALVGKCGQKHRSERWSNRKRAGPIKKKREIISIKESRIDRKQSKETDTKDPCTSWIENETPRGQFVLQIFYGSIHTETDSLSPSRKMISETSTEGKTNSIHWISLRDEKWIVLHKESHTFWIIKFFWSN